MAICTEDLVLKQSIEGSDFYEAFFVVNEIVC